MRYEEPEAISVEQAEVALADDDPERVCVALVRVVHSPLDPAWIEARLLVATKHEAPMVRAAAATCLGHLSRIHGRVAVAKVMPALRRLLQDAETRGPAEDALEDIQIFGRAR